MAGGVCVLRNEGPARPDALACQCVEATTADCTPSLRQLSSHSPPAAVARKATALKLYCRSRMLIRLAPARDQKPRRPNCFGSRCHSLATDTVVNIPRGDDDTGDLDERME